MELDAGEFAEHHGGEMPAMTGGPAKALKFRDRGLWFRDLNVNRLYCGALGN